MSQEGWEASSMVSLAAWLEKHKEQLIATAVQQLSDREPLRQHAAGPVRWFFDSLITAIKDNQQERLETILRHWVSMCRIPIDGEPVGLLPVLGVFKRALWARLQANPPDENPLEFAVQLDTVIGQAAEFLSKVEAAALLDEMSHRLTAQAQTSAALANSTKDHFVSVAAHELKTPLTVIEGYSNMLKMELPEATNPRAALMVQGIESGISRLRGLIEDLIDVSLIEMSLLNLELQPVWLRRLLDIAAFEAGDTVKQRKLILDVKRDTFPAQPIIGDPERLLQAIQKILANAIKYTPDGGRIAVAAREINKFIDITITDSGIGIAPENLDRIFEKFSVVGDLGLHSSGKTKFKGGGAGLGLVIAKGIVEAHGGTIWAASPGYDEEQCPGSAFHMMLPLRDVKSGEGMAPAVATAIGSLANAVLERDSVEKSPQKATSEAPAESEQKETPLPVPVVPSKNDHNKDQTKKGGTEGGEKS
ncbi:MAG: HAMP domain-containing histidine kinase [Chloroflexi bacterium]|nr:HAMP domain-containing histidine kinase [Chloroflexota bacterium]